jgi:quercetin dioxygenase-like cupin family protein
MSITNRKRRIVLTAAMIALGIGATVTYAVLPSTNIDPASIPAPATLAGKTSLDVQSVSSFARAINQAHGTNAVLQHVRLTPGQNTGWHTHPGPNIVMMAQGLLTVIDEHCIETQYRPGQGLATGLDVHEGIAGPEGADFYSLYFLPENADVLRTDAVPPGCARR